MHGSTLPCALHAEKLSLHSGYCPSVVGNPQKLSPAVPAELGTRCRALQLCFLSSLLESLTRYPSLTEVFRFPTLPTLISCILISFRYYASLCKRYTHISQVSPDTRRYGVDICGKSLLGPKLINMSVMCQVVVYTLLYCIVFSLRNTFCTTYVSTQ